jgi:hypothetical protein
MADKGISESLPGDGFWPASPYAFVESLGQLNRARIR